jgi:hypothetical protein
MDPQHYLAFRSKTRQVAYTFIYPAEWQVRESVKEKPVKVFITGPRDREDTFSAGFIVRVSPACTQSPEAVMHDFLDRFSDMPEFRETGRSSGIVGGRPALEAEIEYTLLLPLNHLNPHRKIIRERRVVLKTDGTLVELIYAAPVEMYEAWLPDFRILVHSFDQVREPDGTAFHAVTSVPDVALVRESPADYEVETGESDG